MKFPAKYSGQCRPGGDKIRPGDEIERLGTGYAHSRCVADAAEAGKFDRIEGVMPPEAAMHESLGWSMTEDPEAALAWQERTRANAEYAAGQEDARRERENREMFGEEAAAAIEFDRDLRGLNGEW